MGTSRRPSTVWEIGPRWPTTLQTRTIDARGNIATTLYNADGELPGRKVGREWRFSSNTLRKWIAGESEYEGLAAVIRSQGGKVTRKK